MGLTKLGISGHVCYRGKGEKEVRTLQGSGCGAGQGTRAWSGGNRGNEEGRSREEGAGWMDGACQEVRQ